MANYKQHNTRTKEMQLRSVTLQRSRRQILILHIQRKRLIHDQVIVTAKKAQ
jgi:hypothetical protein